MTANSQSMSRRRRRSRPRGTFSASLKAGIGGGIAISLLLTVYQIAPSFLQTVLIPPALVIVWVVTGIGGAMLCDDKIRDEKDGASVGMVAGIVAGTIGGVTAMVIAALGFTFQFYGQEIFDQLSDSQLTPLVAAGFTNQLIVLSGSIMAALFTCGVGGIIASASLGRLGGWLYPKFSR